MTTQRYSVQQPPISNLFAWIRDGDIAIPEIQRPFVWDATKVRNFLDSLYKGFPVGYLIAWRNPDVKLKDGRHAGGKRILIDGQQRVTALMAALLAQEVVNKDYQQVRIQISFHPLFNQFEVFNSAIAKDSAWIHDIADVFHADAGIFSLVSDYCQLNPQAPQDQIGKSIEMLRGITSNQIGLIELDGDLDIETVTEIFIRVNSEGVPLSQADFAMSKIAANDNYDGSILRKAIDYFCHLSVAPEFYSTFKKDKSFAGSEYFQKMSWLKSELDDLYDPSYTDMLRVAFTSEFRRGRLQDLVALLSGRNFETRQFEEEIVEDSFKKLKAGIFAFINENNFKTFIMIIRSAGFVDSSLIGSQNALNFAYILYLTLRNQGLAKNDIERQVRRWFAMSVLLGRYSGSPESMFDYDIRQIYEQGVETHADGIIKGELSDAYWEITLPRDLTTSSSASPHFRVFQAAQIKMDDRGFLSKDIAVRELIEVKSDLHHIFPRDYLKKKGLPRSQYNQVANYAVTQSEINIAIGNKEPHLYFGQMIDQCNGGPRKYGNITESAQLKDNLDMNCIPQGMENYTIDDYQRFLTQRRELMAKKIRQYFESL